MRIDTISLIISAFVSLFLGVASFIRNHRNPLYQKFALLCFFLMGRDLLCLLKDGDPRLFLPYLWITLAIGPLGMGLLKGLGAKQKVARAFELSYFAFLVLLFGLSLSLNSSTGVEWLPILAEASLVVPTYFWVNAFVNASLQEPFPREKLRFRYAAWGLVAVVAFHITDTLYFSRLSSIIPLGTLARAVYLGFLFQLFILRDLFTWRELVSRICLFGSISFVLSAIYWLLVSWVDSRPGLFLFNTFIASFAILILFEPLKSSVSRLMKSWFLKRSSDLENQLNKLVHELRGLDPKDLKRKLFLCLAEGLPIDSLSLFLSQTRGLDFIRIAEESSFQEEIPAGSPLVEYMVLRRGRAFTLDDLLTDREAFYSVQGKKFIEECLGVLKKLQADLVIPFYWEGKIWGFIAASLKEGSIVGADLLRTLSPLTRPLALFLRNAQVAQVVSERDKLVTVGEMAAGLAHEIKNPLGALKGAAELLMLDQSKEEQKEYLKIIQDESDRLSVVLSRFLDFAKPRKQEPESVTLPLKVIEHVASLCLRNTQEVEFHVSCQDPSIQLAMDPEVLKQVLLNLFLNASQAMEATPHAKLLVEVSAIKNWGQIQIIDNGPGIQPSIKEKVFEPFFTTKQKGTGLGLSICHRLIQSSGGQISIKNNPPGQGTSVVLLIPLYRRAKKVISKQSVPTTPVFAWQES